MFLGVIKDYIKKVGVSLKGEQYKIKEILKNRALKNNHEISEKEFECTNETIISLFNNP